MKSHKKAELRTKPGDDRVFFWLFGAIFLSFVFAISYCNIRSLDLWWHLKTGEVIWNERRIPSVDRFSHSAEGQPWVSHEWLFGLLSYCVYRIAGVAGLVGAKSLLITFIFTVTAWTARIRGSSAAIILLVQAASYAIARFRFSERPELVSTLLASGFLLAQELSRKRPQALLLLPILQLVWVNVHGGTALLGWIIAGVILLERAGELRQQKALSGWNATAAGLQWHFPALLGVVALSFANPHGPRALFYGLLRTESPLDNKEFQSLIIMMQSGFDLSISLFLIFAALLALMLFWRRRDTRLHEWLLFPFLLILAVVFFRFRSLFVFLLGPCLAHHLSQIKWPAWLRTWLPATAALCLMSGSAALERDTYFYRFGAGVHAGVFPVEAARFLKQSGMAGKMFNTYGMGGYLIWELWPGKKVFIDGREDVYLKPGVLEEYVRCFESRERWHALVARYGIDFAILRYPESPPSSPERSVEVLAFSRQEWALIYFDEVAAIYARRNGLNDELIRKSEIRMVQPLQLSSYLDEIARDPMRMRQFLAEIQANLEQHPSSFRNHFTLGMLAVKRGPDHLGEALREFERTIEINPDFAPAYVNLGSIYRHLGRNREAEKVLKKALSLEDNPLARSQLDQLRQLQ